jgi:hypothetical protein
MNFLNNNNTITKQIFETKKRNPFQNINVEGGYDNGYNIGRIPVNTFHKEFLNVDYSKLSKPSDPTSNILRKTHGAQLNPKLKKTP